MYKDPEPELIVHVDDNLDEKSVEIQKIDENPPISERFNLWLEIIDN